MNTCSKCQKKASLPPAALEINNPCDPVLFHKVIYPAALGDDTTAPPDTLNYKNVLLVYEANEHAYLYSSDGAATFISMAAVDLTAIKEELAQHGIDIDNLKTEVATIQGDVETLQNSLAEETQNRQDADENLQDQITTNAQSITSLNATVASQGEQITNLETNLQDTTTELQTEIANETLARAEADDTLQSNIDSINTNLNQEVEKETDFTTDTSTVTVQHTKVNLSNNDTNITVDPLPVASETQAGVMNTATYQAIQNNAENVDAILNGAIALNGIAATPTQEELTTAWETATGRTALINRASIWDLDNEKVWYYYENINEWKSIPVNPEGEQVTVSTFTNTTPGIIKGSEEDGQLFAEADGTGSVVGWDGVKHDVENIVELLETNPIPKLYAAYSSNTDGANTANFINTILNGRSVKIGSLAVSNDDNIAIGYQAAAYSTSSTNGRNLIAIGPYANVRASDNFSIALGYYANTSRPYELSIGNASLSDQYAYKTRYLSNVTAGELDTDAVNVKQMKDYVTQNVPPTVIVATPTIDESVGAQLLIDGPNGATEPVAGTMVLLQIPSSKVGEINLPFSVGTGLQLAYTGGSPHPIKFTNSTSALTSLYTPLYIINSYSQYLLMYDGTQWLVLMPQSAGSTMTTDEFNAAWEAA